MKWQETEYYCGPASLSAAFRALGVTASQGHIAREALTTEAEGTDEHGIQRAVLAFGFGVDELAFSDRLAAKVHLRHCMLIGRPVVLCTHRWTHWVCVTGMLGTKFLVFDPARTLQNKRTGVYTYNWDRLSKLWRASYRTRGRGPKYYGVAVCPV
jgi:ABC-type bacteriocin/lantibiotic exporter with double-glycine peptidase domain